jgi:hypothetical protein
VLQSGRRSREETLILGQRSDQKKRGHLAFSGHPAGFQAQTLTTPSRPPWVWGRAGPIPARSLPRVLDGSPSTLGSLLFLARPSPDAGKPSYCAGGPFVGSSGGNSEGSRSPAGRSPVGLREGVCHARREWLWAGPLVGVVGEVSGSPFLRVKPHPVVIPFSCRLVGWGEGEGGKWGGPWRKENH